MTERLQVDPAELHFTGAQLDGHSSDFQAAQQRTHRRAGDVSVGSGAASAALPQMLSAWEDDNLHFAGRLTAHADDHREAARRYVATDVGGAEGIDGAGSAF